VKVLRRIEEGIFDSTLNSERRTKMKRIAIGLIVTGVVVGLLALGAVPYKKPLLGVVLSLYADEGGSVASRRIDFRKLKPA
jgi:hypothetical protein